MASINRTKTLDDEANRQDIYELISTAGVTGLEEGDLSEDYVVLATQSDAPATLTSTRWWWDQTEQLLKLPLVLVGASPASCYLAVGPDSWHYPGFNAGTKSIRRGDLVRWSYSSAGPYDVTSMEPVPSQVTHTQMLRTVPQLTNLAGIAAATILAGQFGPICAYGFAHAWVDLKTVDSYRNTWQNSYASELVPSSQYTGTLQAPLGVAPEKRADVVAMLLARPESTGMTFMCPVFCMFPPGKKVRSV